MFSLTVLLACCACTFALDPSLDVSQYAHSSWKVRDGFTIGAINPIAQTPDGYLWLGTDFGLVRFDGVRTVLWSPPENQPLPQGAIRSLLVSPNGALWIGTWTGLASWKDGKLTRYPDLDGEIVFALLEDREGTVWAGAGGTPGAGKLCAIRNSVVNCVGGDGRFGPAVAGLYQDSGGNLWVGVSNGLWKWKPGVPKNYMLPGELDGPALGEDSNGTLLVGWKGALYRFIDGKMDSYPISGLSRPFRARTILRDRNGSLWIALWNHGLVHVHQGKADVFSALDGLSGDDVDAIFEDHEGNVWVSTNEGLDRFRDFAVDTLTVKQGLSRDLVGSVLAGKDGSVWLATYGGLNRWHHGEITIPSPGSSKGDGKLSGSNSGSLFQDYQGRIWISTPRELGYLETGGFAPIKGVPAGNVLSMAQDTGRNLWVLKEPVGLLRISPQNDIQRILWSDLGIGTMRAF